MPKRKPRKDRVLRARTGGRKATKLKIEGDWKEAVKTAMRRGKPGSK